MLSLMRLTMITGKYPRHSIGDARKVLGLALCCQPPTDAADLRVRARDVLKDYPMPEQMLSDFVIEHAVDSWFPPDERGAKLTVIK